MNKLTLESAVARLERKLSRDLDKYKEQLGSEIKVELLGKSETELTDNELVYVEGFKAGYTLRDNEDTLNLLPQDDATLSDTAQHHFEREIYLLEYYNDTLTEKIDAIQWEFNKFQTAVSRAIGGCDFMNLPDGGEVTLPEQVSRMREHGDKCQSQLLEVLNLIYSAAIGEVCMGYNSNIECIAQSAFEITGISEPETRRKFEPLSD